MNRNSVTAGALAFLVAAAPANRVMADAGDFIGGVAAGVIGSAIANSQKTKQRTVVVRQAPSPQYSALRARVRDNQAALNHFGFPAGTPDGVTGPRTRAAISAYQAFIGMPATGEMTEFQRNVLVTAHARVNSGAPDVARVVSTDPLGVKAVLMDQYELMTGKPGKRQAVYAGMPVEVSEAIDEIANSSDPSAEQLLQRAGFVQLADLNSDGNTDYIIDTAVSGSSFWCNATACKTLVFASTANGYARNDLLLNQPTAAALTCVGGSCVVQGAQTQMAVVTPRAAPAPQDPGPQMAAARAAAPEAAAESLPVFPVTATKKSLSSHCSRVSLMTNANGGFTTLATMGDAEFVLDEQFCLARTYAIETGEKLVAGMQGISTQQVAAQCAQYGNLLKPYVSALSLKPRTEVIRDVGGFVLSTGQDPEQLATTAKICLSTGYKSDDMDVAVGSALVLVVLGEGAYGELMGHHLMRGIGASKRPALAEGWYTAALADLAAGAPAVFAPGLSERSDLVRKAVAGGTSVAPSNEAVRGSATSATLPTFGAAAQ